MMDRFTPLLLAALMAWIMCVCVHEFGHALVAYLGGDRSVRLKGYLSLNPLRFVDPVFSVLVPAIVLALGGLPLPGGAVQIDEAALRSRRWSLLVSAAGPASNFALFLLFSLPLHPRLGLVDARAAELHTWVYFCGAMAFLNFFATLLNLIPVPPLDGYKLIEHRLSSELQWKLRQPQNAMLAISVLFVLLWVWPQLIMMPVAVMFALVTGPLGLPAGLMLDGFHFVLFGLPPP